MNSEAIKQKMLWFVFRIKKTPTTLNDSFSLDTENVIIVYEKPFYYYLWNSIWPLILPILCTIPIFSIKDYTLSYLIIFCVILSFFWYLGITVILRSISHLKNPRPEWIISKEGVTCDRSFYLWSEIEESFFLHELGGYLSLRMITKDKKLGFSITSLNISSIELGHYIEAFKKASN
ncbi:MAG: hypothetical protein OEW97_09390 [Gammaproteobacteria bacterium]|nr:hypothetical protein [Gammaproteobacteria bacterium]